MKNENKASQPFWMLFFVILVLLIVSTFNNRLDIGAYQSKEVAPVANILLKGVVRDALLPFPLITNAMLVKDSLAYVQRQLDPSRIVDFKTDSTSTLASFFEALKSTQENKTRTRIAYFGDSMIEGDLMSQDLRSLMQDRFGGYGVGYVPITSIVSQFRKTVRHTFDGWKTYNFFKEPPAGHNLSISGYGYVTDKVGEYSVSDLRSDVWVKYKTVGAKGLNKFHKVKMLYGSSADKNAVIINSKRYPLKGKAVVNELLVDPLGDSTKLEAYFQCKSPLDVYGFSFESDAGVIVDNYSFRGNSGLPNYRVPKSVYSGVNDHLKYDLIILQYGLNATNPSTKNYRWYEVGINNVVRHIKASFPGVSILLVSVGDKSYQKDGQFKTDPSVPLLLETQKRVAVKNELAYWSLYETMGGMNSMVKWVEGDTVYAKKDYAHFNAKGAAKVGGLLFNKLMAGYKDYLKNTN